MKSEKEIVVSREKDVSLDEIKARKKLLKEKINGIENKYTRKVTTIKGKVRKSLKPIQRIREKPFKTVGTFIAVGFIIGILGRKKSTSSSSSESSSSAQSSESIGSSSGFTSFLLFELKRLAAQKAMIYISEILDQKVMPKIIIKPSDKRENPHDKT